MSNEFVFNARQFYDFFTEIRQCPINDDENLDSYFETDHERGQPEGAVSPKEDSPGADLFFSPLKATPIVVRPKAAPNGMASTSQPPEVSSTTKTLENEVCTNAAPKGPAGPKPSPATSSRIPRTLRKSTSAGNVRKADSSLCESMKKLSTNNNQRPRLSRADVPKNNLARSKSVSRSRENLNRLAQPKRQFNSNERLNYVTMAEAIKKFENGTPVRFRSKSQSSHRLTSQLKCTKPQSPKLITKIGARPVSVVSREEKEKIELNEAKKFKIKARPVNKKILQGPLKPQHVEKRPLTKPEPFKLTEKLQKPTQSEPDTYQFHAKPVPKSLNEPFIPVFNEKMVTEPQTPTFVREYNGNLAEKQMNNIKDEQIVYKKDEKIGRTRLMPFSFETRNQDMLKKKEEFLKKVMEEEKKLREFHANPVPKAVLKASLTKCKSTSDCSSPKTLQRSQENLLPQFKARPAAVLKVKPFEPKKPECHLVEISEFQLNTDRRAKEREEFEERMRRREEAVLEMKKHEKEMQERKEENERIKLRKEAVHKAQPIKKYKEVKIAPSNRVTDPISPKFQSKNKENVI